jgi:hypothetical protein
VSSPEREQVRIAESLARRYMIGAGCLPYIPPLIETPSHNWHNLRKLTELNARALREKEKLDG